MIIAFSVCHAVITTVSHCFYYCQQDGNYTRIYVTQDDL